MKISTVREFREGVFFPWPEGTILIELKREVFSILSEQVRRQLSKKGTSEDDILSDFAAWRKNRRATRRRR